MTKYPSDYVSPRTSYVDKEPPEIKRKYSILPMRAIQDRNLNLTDLKVLGAICIHTNSKGIAWPSLTTLARHVGIAMDTVSTSTARLTKSGYIRKLQPRKYKKMPRVKGKRATTRYQVLFEGKQTPLPELEDFYAAAPKFITQHDGENETPSIIETKGVEGVSKLKSLSLASAFCKTVANVTGELRMPENQRSAADELALAGITPEQVAEATEQQALQAKQRGSPAPMTLELVAKNGGFLT